MRWVKHWEGEGQFQRCEIVHVSAAQSHRSSPMWRESLKTRALPFAAVQAIGTGERACAKALNYWQSTLLCC
jgi:hypothetical protein